jgi:hypothetical protein
MTILTESQIEGARLLTLRQMLRLEMRGMRKSRGPTAYATLKALGFKGSREKVLAQMDEIRNQLVGESK